MLCYSMLLSLGAEELVQESDQCWQITQVEMKSLLGITWLFKSNGNYCLIEYHLDQDWVRIPHNKLPWELDAVVKGGPKFPPALCSKWRSACQAIGAKRLPSNYELNTNICIHHFMHSHYAKWVDQGCTHLQQFTSPQLQAILHPQHIPLPTDICNQSNHANMIS